MNDFLPTQVFEKYDRLIPIPKREKKGAFKHGLPIHIILNDRQLSKPTWLVWDIILLSASKSHPKNANPPHTMTPSPPRDTSTYPAPQT